MMKKSKLFGWAFVALAGLSACTNDAGDAFAGENEIRLTSKIAHSRVTSLDYQSTQIVQEQEVGITITGAKSTHKNVAWNVGEDGKLNNTGEPVFWANGDVTITAYHPYHSTWTSTSHDFSVSTDQSNEANYRNSDLLWTMATASKTENAIPLVFEHKLSKVNVTLKSENLEDLSGAAISICGTNIATTFNPTTGNLSAASDADIQEIKAGVTTSSSYTASAIVVPQTVAYGTKFIKIVLGDRTFYYTLNTDKELRAGYSHNYTLNINEKEVTTESDKITDWEDDDNEGDVEEEVVVIPSNQIWYTATEKVTPYTTDGFGANILSNEWDSTTGEGVITFDGDVTSIDHNAFRWCFSLASIGIPNSVTRIGASAFWSCSSLTFIDIPDGVTSIGASAFSGCSSLTSIDIPDGVTSIYIHTFDGCSSLASIDIPDGVTTISASAFSGCSSLTSIDIPDGVTTIDYSAFYGCSSLTSIYLPDGVTSIGGYAFGSCSSLTSIYLPDGVTSIGGYAFGSCSSLTSIDIPDGVTSIGDSAFQNCSSLTSIDIPDGVTSINLQVFDGCSSLASIYIPDGVTSIGGFAFYGCSSLTSIAIPASVTSIDYSAFRGCNSLTDFYSHATTPPSIITGSSPTFSEYDDKTTLHVPAGCVTKYQSKWGVYFKNIVEMK